jgi:hypothetical protein
MGKKTRALVNRIGNKLKRVASGVKKGISKAITKVQGVVKTISTKFGGAFSSITSKIASWGSSLMKGMEAAKQKVAEFAKKVAGSSVGKAASATKGFFSKAAGFVGDKVGKATKAVGGVASSAASKAASVGSAVAAKGAQVAKSGAQAVKSVGSAVGGKALDIAKSGMKEAAKKSGSILKLLGKAAGSRLLGPVLEGIFAKKDINKMQDDHAAGKSYVKTPEELAAAVGLRGVKAGGGVLGGLGGASLGAFLGPIGAIAGGVLGDIGGRWVGENIIAPMMGSKVDEVGRWALDSWMFRNYVPKLPGEPLAQVDDGIIFSQNGKMIAQANPMDTVYAMKQGGPLLATLATGFESNGKLLSNLHELHADHMYTQIELDEERNSLLLELGKLLYSSLDTGQKQGALKSTGYDAAKFAGNSVQDSRAFTGSMMG